MIFNNLNLNIILFDVSNEILSFNIFNDVLIIDFLQNSIAFSC